MCGIIAGATHRPIVPILLEGLRRLEYRGYDSAGLCVLDQNHSLQKLRAVGKVAALTDKARQHNLDGTTGIAHTRWATHGAATEANAHPHLVGQVAVVHNGIVENVDQMKAQLQADGAQFNSETDTEVVAHLIDRELACHEPVAAIQRVAARLQGSYGIVCLIASAPGQLFAMRSGSPLVVGLGVEENFLSSDTLSLQPVTSEFIYLEEGDIAHVSTDQVQIYDQLGKPVERPRKICDQAELKVSKDGFSHYMAKEIYQQPEVIRRTLQRYTEKSKLAIGSFPAGLSDQLAGLKAIKIIACGTSYHASIVAKYWLEAYVGLPCDVEIASEFRYRPTLVPEACLFIAVSQSGETADTLAALRQAQAAGFQTTLAITNVASSSLDREADWTLYTEAGPEIGVASTKAFTTQLTIFALLTLLLQQSRGQADQNLLQQLMHMPAQVEQVLTLDASIQQLAHKLVHKEHCLFLGRGVLYPIALEGALKLKEISYIHAEAYPAGELKHGPLALVDEDMPVVVLAAQNDVLEKVKANMSEIEARGGQIYAVSHCNHNPAQGQITIESSPSWMDPIIFTIPLQLMSYHVATLRGTDVDQPRNLAKSVTVE